MRSIRLCLCFTIFLNACGSTELIRDREYRAPMNSYRLGDPEGALNEFPKKERDGFITSVEKSWLGIWTGAKEKPDLEKHVKGFDERSATSLTREAETFLFQESEEGYVPSEPEVVILHLVAAMIELQEKRWDRARVEAKRVAFYLRGSSRSAVSGFDDPALRLWLAGVWAALGEWNEARVDFRRANEIAPNPKMAAWANRSAPAEFRIRFTGVGPVLDWTAGTFPPASIADANPPEGEIVLGTDRWMAWHFHRNTVLRDQLVKSNYMAQETEIKTASVAGKVMAGAAAAGAIFLGIVVGVGLVVGAIAVLSQGGGGQGSGEALVSVGAVGAKIATGTAEHASAWNGRVNRGIDDHELERLESIKIYRTLRFMPRWIVFDLSDTLTPRPEKGTLPVRAPASKTETVFINTYGDPFGRSYFGSTNRQILRRADSLPGSELRDSFRSEDRLDRAQWRGQVDADENLGGFGNSGPRVTQSLQRLAPFLYGPGSAL